MTCLPSTFLENVEARETELRRARTLCYALESLLQAVRDRLAVLEEIAPMYADEQPLISNDAADREALRKHAGRALEKLGAMKSRVVSELVAQEKILDHIGSQLKHEALQFQNASLSIEIGRIFTLDDGRRIMVNTIEFAEPQWGLPSKLRIEGPYLRKDGKLGATVQCESAIYQAPATHALGHQIVGNN